MATNCLLAPVPIAHLRDAVETAKSHGVVAFGSNSFELLHRLKKTGAIEVLEVYIVTSKMGFRSGDDRQSGFQVGKVQLRGRLHNIVEAVRGKHPNKDLMPKSALDGDGDWGMFWEVSDLTQIAPLALSKFSTKSGKAWESTPKRPVEAHLGSES